MLSPILEKLTAPSDAAQSTQTQTRSGLPLDLVTINTDEQPELAMEYNVSKKNKNLPLKSLFPPFFFLFSFVFWWGWLINQPSFEHQHQLINCGYKWAWVLTNHYIVRSLLYIYIRIHISVSRFLDMSGTMAYIYISGTVYCYIAILLSWTERPSLVTQVRSLPTVLAFKDGKVVNQFVGALPEPHVKKCVFVFFVLRPLFFILYFWSIRATTFISYHILPTLLPNRPPIVLY